MLVGQEGKLGVQRVGGGRTIDREYAIAGVDHIAGGDETVGVDEIATEHPEQLLVLRRFKPEFLAQRLDVDILALVQVEPVARTENRFEQIEEKGFLDRKKVKGIAGQDFLHGIIGRDRGDREIVALVAELGRDIENVAIILPPVVHPDRQAGIVDVVDDVEIERLRFQSGIGGPQIQRDVVARIEQQVSAHGNVPIGVSLFVQERVAQIAVGIDIGSRHPEFQIVGNRSAQSAAHLPAKTIVDADFQLAFQDVGWLLGVDDDRAANGISAIEAALRTLQDFDLLDVEQFLVELRRIDLLHAIDNHRDRWFGVARLGNAANDDEGIAGILRFDQIDIGRQVDEVDRLFDAGRFDRLCGKGGHRSGNILKIGITPGCRHDDDIVIRLFFGLRKCGSRRQARHQYCRRQ